ncbi:PHP domain-containing protein [Gordonia rhizosphera]|uniref:Polymerase/histidinol phosphatase N-terminal domain-containing protein n=1 Tax=Gordonia rhizosphera NBRC 16068 TaxID=1108045 RepID=K6VXI2_9ACTN|nr:PHP domain-containing protein [Gordonia rhizosphera]GAB91635.1 hypothetical protein GORHZ_141_00100 [Gordonia rhizosphera NBRC 16068]
MRLLVPLVAPVDPVDALTRIAWLLEHDRQSTYRVEAFRRAAQAVADTDPGELRRCADMGTLTAIERIGKSTAAVIAEAVAGDLPGYLAHLQEEESSSVPADDSGLFTALRGDLHAHTDWSDGGAPLDEMAAAATALGHEWLAITDHSPRLTVANGLSVERLDRQITEIAALNARSDDDGFRVLAGIEVDILDDGTLDQTDAMLDRLDVVTASVHSKLRMDPGSMTRRMVAAVSDPRVNVLGHCTGRRVLGGRRRPPSEFDAREVFAACAAHGTAVEINSRPERVDPPDDLIELARDLGCLFAIDSDAHAPGQLGFKGLGARRAEEFGIEADRIVTTWPLDDVLAWASA